MGQTWAISKSHMHSITKHHLYALKSQLGQIVRHRQGLPVRHQPVGEDHAPALGQVAVAPDPVEPQLERHLGQREPLDCVVLGLGVVDGLVGDLDLGLVGVRLLVQADDVVEGDAVALDADLRELG